MDLLRDDQHGHDRRAKMLRSARQVPVGVRAAKLFDTILPRWPLLKPQRSKGDGCQRELTNGVLGAVISSQPVLKRHVPLAPVAAGAAKRDVLRRNERLVVDDVLPR